jgi:hypothetical protein
MIIAIIDWGIWKVLLLIFLDFYWVYIPRDVEAWLPIDRLEVLTLAGLIAYYDLCLNPETTTHYAQMQLLEAPGVS